VPNTQFCPRLLGVNIDVAELLPPDSMSHGFDNMSDVLNLSPALMEGYVRAASRSAAKPRDPDALAITKTYQISRVQNQMHHVEGTPFGTRAAWWSIMIFLRWRIPV